MTRLPPHIFWPALATALMGTTVTLATIAVYLAVTDPSFAIEANYYEKAVNWDERAAQLRENERLGWTTHATFSPLDTKGERLLTVTLQDKLGKPITSARLTCEVFHRARSMDRFELSLLPTPVPGQYRASDVLTRHGYWKVLLTASVGDVTFTNESIVSAPEN